MLFACVASVASGWATQEAGELNFGVVKQQITDVN
jgi:hypothetical protein